MTNFLGPMRSRLLLDFFVSSDFARSLVPSRVGPNLVHQTVRRSLRARHALPALERAIVDHLRDVCDELGIDHDLSGFNYECVVHRDGDFFAPHADRTGDDPAPRRGLTFVYYAHAEPRAFEGGALRIYDADPSTCSGAAYRDVEPEHDSIIFFHPDVVHEVREVRGVGTEIRASRFSVNGWLHETRLGESGL